MLSTKDSSIRIWCIRIKTLTEILNLKYYLGLYRKIAQQEFGVAEYGSLYYEKTALYWNEGLGLYYLLKIAQNRYFSLSANPF